MRARLKQFKPFVLRLAMATAFFGIVYGLVFVVPDMVQRSKDQPSLELARLKSSVTENQLALSQFNKGEDVDVDAIVRLDNMRGKLDQTLTTLQEVHDSFKQLAPPDKQTLESLISLERDALTILDSRLELLRKPLSYNPDSDLSLRVSVTGLQDRAQTAAGALNRLGTHNSVPGELQKKLQSSSDCFTRFAKRLAEASLDTPTKQIRTACIQEYRELRRDLYVYITAPFNQEQTGVIVDRLKSLQEVTLPD